MCEYQYDFSGEPNTTSPDDARPPRCVCTGCLQSPRTKVFLNGEHQGFTVFAAVGDPDGLLVQWKPLEDGKFHWSISKGKVTIEIE